MLAWDFIQKWESYLQEITGVSRRWRIRHWDVNDVNDEIFFVMKDRGTCGEWKTDRLINADRFVNTDTDPQHIISSLTCADQSCLFYFLRTFISSLSTQIFYHEKHLQLKALRNLLRESDRTPFKRRVASSAQTTSRNRQIFQDLLRCSLGVTRNK